MAPQDHASAPHNWWEKIAPYCWDASLSSLLGRISTTGLTKLSKLCPETNASHRIFRLSLGKLGRNGDQNRRSKGSQGQGHTFSSESHKDLSTVPRKIQPALQGIEILSGEPEPTMATTQVKVISLHFFSKVSKLVLYTEMGQVALTQISWTRSREICPALLPRRAPPSP